VESTLFRAAAYEVLLRLLIYSIVKDRRVMTITIPVRLFSMLHGAMRHSQKTRYRSLSAMESLLLNVTVAKRKQKVID
jgi:hypothetical protein